MPRPTLPIGTTTATIDLDDLQAVYRFIVGAAVVEGPAELRAIVASNWPELLYKIKPPVDQMH